MRTIFFGTSEFAVPALEALNKEGFDLTVVTMPDQPSGRKKIITSPVIKAVADKLGLKTFQPATLKDDAFFEEFKALAPDICVVAAYGKIIPEKYLEIPKHFLNIHPSLLPKYRGPTPVQTAVLNGDETTGVSIMQVDKDVDHGPIFKQTETPIEPDETYSLLHDRLAEEGAQLLVEVIKNIETIKPEAQDDTQATFTKIFERPDGRIDWTRSAGEIHNQIRALNPEPGTWTMWNEKIINIKKAERIEGKLTLSIIQLEGKKETTLSEFLHGHPDFNVSQLK
ncbi:MAG: methionyl-tRNA formyltransferase [Candidatus Pacebacteria bacterium]|nr:methionyl-tRNA formyltransferase [Candidatus Paceibacterota bacterium]